jgi:predicted O-methyltransferase YrrM
MTTEQGESITAHVLQQGASSLLELGFHHGVSTCYLAWALEELGQGHLTTIDRLRAKNLSPNVEELLTRLGVRDRVTVYYEPTSYVWRLMKLLEAERRPTFDFCYIDGAHSWFVDGFAFYLVDQMLENGGWILFDDLNWTYAASPSLSGTPLVRSMPDDERTTPQIRQVYELLVKTHPSYGEFHEADGWAWARKIGPTSRRAGIAPIKSPIRRRFDRLRNQSSRLIRR